MYRRRCITPIRCPKPRQYPWLRQHRSSNFIRQQKKSNGEATHKPDHALGVGGKEKFPSDEVSGAICDNLEMKDLLDHAAPLQPSAPVFLVTLQGGDPII